MMEPSTQEIITAQAIQLALFGIFAVVAYVIARALKLFRIPPNRSILNKSPLSWQHVAIAFGLYLVVEAIVLPAIASVYAGISGMEVGKAFEMGTGAYALFSIGGIILAATVVVTYVLRCEEGRLRFLWCSRAGGRVMLRDIGIGAVSLFVAYPAALTIGNFLSIGVVLVYGPQHSEQVAVQFFRATLGDPVLFWSTVLTLVVVVPIVEECLFRMMLQSWLRQLFSMKGAVVVASLVFSIFHFAVAQGVANVHLLASLFLLSCFLGFVYERQRSLWAPIALHAAFNGTSILTMLLFE
ncbi:hypothetical protein SCG7086_AS_00180 [Chlamydiales bacterium SCGC AG-110-P3]|nr:hypothetical protein SCG7086_AS_00180 [Chlamydiales bacterium SCGC AG-110-P3]